MELARSESFGPIVAQEHDASAPNVQQLTQQERQGFTRFFHAIKSFIHR
jgi:hypothetical protein